MHILMYVYLCFTYISIFVCVHYTFTQQMQIAFAFFLRRSRSLLNLIFTVKVASAPADNVNVIAI